MSELVYCQKLVVCFESITFYCISILEKYGRGRFNKIDTLWIEMCCTQLRLIEAVFEDFANTEFNGIHNLILVEPLITPKALKLLDILRENKSGT